MAHSFTRPLPEDISSADKYAPALRITEVDDAKAFFDTCVEHAMRTGGMSREAAERVERENIGYWGGYGTFEQRVRLEQFLGAVHPVFGSTAHGPVTAEQAMALGEKLGRTQRGERMS